MEQPPQDTHAAPVAVVTGEEWRRMALRWPSEWVTRPTRWILHLAVGLHALGALVGWLGPEAPGFLRLLPGPHSLFEPVSDPAHRVAGAALVGALLVLVVVHWALGRLLAWVTWLELGAMAWVTLRSGEATAVLWTTAWAAVGLVCLGACVPIVLRAATLRRWADRATGWTFLDAESVDPEPARRRLLLVGGLVLVGVCVMWNGTARVVLRTGSEWPPSLFGDLVPWGLGLLGLCLVLIDVVAALAGTLLRHAVPPMVIEFPTGTPGALASRLEAAWLPVDTLRDLPDCTCEASYRRAHADDGETVPAVPPDRRCPHHGHQYVNELTSAEFLTLARQRWVWDDSAPVRPEDLIDFDRHPGRVIGFGFEGLGGLEEYRSLTEQHRRHGIRFVERKRFSLLRRHPPAPTRITLTEASRGEVIDTVDLEPVGVAGVAVRSVGDYPCFVPRDRAGEPTRG